MKWLLDVLITLIISMVLFYCKGEDIIVDTGNGDGNDPTYLHNEVEIGDIVYGSIKEKGAHDRYNLRPEYECYIHFVLEEAVSNSSYNPHIKILDSRKTVIAQDTDYARAVAVNVQLKPYEIYTIEVGEWSNDATGNYILKIERDINDDHILSELIWYQGEIQYVGDRDNYILNAAETAFYHIVAKEFTTNSDYNPTLRLYENLTGSLIASHSSYTQAVIVNHNLVEGEKYIVEVSEWSDDRSGKYLVRYEKDADDNIQINGVPVSITGAIQYIGDKDVFTFNPPSSSAYTIVLKEMYSNSVYNPEIKIYDEYNTLIASKTSYTECVLQNITLYSHKSYRIIVQEWSNDAAGQYVLTIEYY